MKYFNLIFLLFTALFSKEHWLNLESGKVENIYKYTPLKRVDYGSDIVVFGSSQQKQKVFQKLENPKGELSITVRAFLQEKDIFVDKAEVELTSKDDENLKYKSRTNKEGKTDFSKISFGEYFVKIEKDNKIFFGEVTINSSSTQREFFIREANKSNYFLKKRDFTLLSKNSLQQTLPLEIINSGKEGEKVCVKLEFNKEVIRNYWSDKRCVYIGSRKSTVFPIHLLFRGLNSSIDGDNLTAIVYNEEKQWRFPLSLDFSFSHLDIVTKNSVQGLKKYIFSKGTFQDLSKKSTIIARDNQEYKLTLYSKKDLGNFHIDIGRDKNITDESSLLKPHLPFELIRSIEFDFGTLKEYKFYTSGTIILEEDSKTFSKRIFDEDIESIQIDNPTLAKVVLKNGILNITPKQNRFGDATISLLSKDENEKYYIKQKFNLKITPINDAPVIIFEPANRVKLGKRYNYLFRSFDIDDTNLSQKILLKPNWLHYDPKKRELSGIAPTKKREYVILEVSDLETTVRKSFFIDVY